MSHHSPHEEPALRAMTRLIRASEICLDQVGELLKEHNLSPLQFHVLRILRTAGEEGLPSLTIKQRLDYRVVDITRLVDRLEGAKLVQRVRPPHDRRLVLVQLSPKGHALLEQLDGPYVERVRSLFQNTGHVELQQLDGILERLGA